MLQKRGHCFAEGGAHAHALQRRAIGKMVLHTVAHQLIVTEDVKYVANIKSTPDYKLQLTIDGSVPENNQFTFTGTDPILCTVSRTGNIRVPDVTATLSNESSK